MSDESADLTAMRDWWKTDIIDMQPGIIRYWGYPVEQLIGQVSFAQMVWLMLRGELPSRDQAGLLDAALTAAVDHGPQAPSIAIARMASTCGVGLNNAMASGLNALGDIHGGAGEQAVEFYQRIEEVIDSGLTLRDAVAHVLTDYWAKGGNFVPGYGHRFHPVDPRAPRLMTMVREYAKRGAVSGRYADIAQQVETAIAQHKGKRIPMNIDGATAVIFAELGFKAPLARGLFCLSRSVGILAHAWEQRQEKVRNKGPIPRQYIWRYSGPAPRDVPRGKDGEVL